MWQSPFPFGDKIENEEFISESLQEEQHKFPIIEVDLRSKNNLLTYKDGSLSTYFFYFFIQLDT